MTQPFFKKQYFALSLDPVHVGTGGYRLGHVDNTILRESGTNLPKIPGSSINGVLRAYTAMSIQNRVEGDWISRENGFWVLDCKKYRQLKYLRPVYELMNGESSEQDSAKVNPDTKGDGPLLKEDKDENPLYHSCAGKGGKDGQAHCGRHDCPVCTAFGFSIGDKGSFQGLVQFYDMRILLFPVYTSAGTVWITSAGTLADAAMKDPPDIPENQYISTLVKKPDTLYMAGFKFTEAPDDKKASDIPGQSSIPEPIRNRMVILSDECFSRMVNAGLEVRTSVAIDPETGAADEGALFTFEAIPRSTIMQFDIIFTKPEFFRIDNQKIPFTHQNVKTTIEEGLKMMETLGIGGMNTRGMGRVRVLNLENDKKGDKNGEH